MHGGYIAVFQEASSSRSQSSEPKSEHQPIEVAVVSRNESEPVQKDKEERPQKPDHDAYPSLPGTPEPHLPEMSVQQTKRKSLPPELPSKRTHEEVNSQLGAQFILQSTADVLDWRRKILNWRRSSVEIRRVFLIGQSSRGEIYLRVTTNQKTLKIDLLSSTARNFSRQI